MWFLFDISGRRVDGAQKNPVALYVLQRSVEVDQRDRNFDWLGDVQSIKVHVTELDVAPSPQAQVDRIQDGRFSAVTPANQAVHARRWKPYKVLNLSEVLDLNLKNLSHDCSLLSVGAAHQASCD